MKCREYEDRLAIVPRGYKKIVDVCGLRWPRAMPVIAAAAYIGLTEFRFRSEPELAKLIQTVFGAEVVDRFELDEMQDRITEAHRKARKAERA